MLPVLRKKPFLALFSTTLILLSAFAFQNPNIQGINWTFPYFSGAANFERLFDWQISPSDYETAVKLTDQRYREYKHKKTEYTITNTFNNYGYLLIALTAQKVFPFLGDIQGAILLQLLVHLLVCLFLVLKVFESCLMRYGFLFLYAANPLIVYFVTFPLYYFWMFIPSMALVVLWFKPEWRRWSIFALTPLLLLSLLIRPATVFLCFLFFVLAWFSAKSRRDYWDVLVAIGIFGVGFFCIADQGSRSPWHTIYVGVGAYENSLGVPDLGDHTGFEYFRTQTGVSIDTNAVRGNWNNVELRSRYFDVLKARYFEMCEEAPLLLLKNATVNMLQVFSPGYIVGHPWLTWACTAVGFSVLLFLLYARQYIGVIAVFSSAAGFAFYFPPIPAYNFAAYLLLTVSILRAIGKMPLLTDSI